MPERFGTTLNLSDGSSCADRRVRPLALDPVFGPPPPDGGLGRLGPYRVLKRLGAGGMGAVYLAHDEGLDRRVALKVLPPDAAADPVAKERFLLEARAAAAVKHDHVVTIYQVGEGGGVPFIAMEFLSGTPLDEYVLRKGRLTVPQALRVGWETAEGLAAAHALGLVHRDIKPANIWLEAPKGRVKILDFGIARRVAEEPRTALTGTGTVVGTPGYMSPEQARGKALDARTDLFSLGVVLYQLLTGRLPFDGDTTMAVLTALAVDDPPPVRTLNPDVPPAFEAVVHRLLAKNPDDRPVSAEVVAAELRALADGGPGLPAPVVYVTVVAEAPGSGVFDGLGDGPTEPVAERPRTPRAARKRAQGLWWAAGAAVLLAAGLVVGTVYAVRKPAAPKEPPPPEPKTHPLVPLKPAAKPAPPPQPEPERPPEPVNGVNPDFAAAFTRLLNGQPLTDRELETLQNSHGKLVIRVPFTPIDDAGFEKLCGCRWATEAPELQLTAPNVTDAGFAHAAKLRSVRVLTVAGARVTDAGLGPLASLPDLTRLGLSGTRLTDKAAPHLAGLKTLASLDLSQTAFGNEGLNGLAPLTGLVELNLRGTPVTDAGLAHLHGRQLMRIDLRDTKTTPAGLKRLSDELPPGALVIGDPPKP